MKAKDGSAGFDFAGSYAKVVPNELNEYSLGDRAINASQAGQIVRLDRL
jgi:hypothetical protein